MSQSKVYSSAEEALKGIVSDGANARYWRFWSVRHT